MCVCVRVCVCVLFLSQNNRYSPAQFLFSIVGKYNIFVSCVMQLNIVDGKMQYLFDEDGRRYLDAFGGIATVCCGHCHPEVIDAIINQTKRLQHSTVVYLNHAIADFAEALASKMPGDLKVSLSWSTCYVFILLAYTSFSGCLMWSF